MKNEWFDQQFRDQYNLQSSPIDLDDAWSALEQRRKSRKSSFVWRWTTLALMLMIAISGAIVFFHTGKEVNSVTRSIASDSAIKNKAMDISRSESDASVSKEKSIGLIEVEPDQESITHTIAQREKHLLSHEERSRESEFFTSKNTDKILSGKTIFNQQEQGFDNSKTNDLNNDLALENGYPNPIEAGINEQEISQISERKSTIRDDESSTDKPSKLHTEFVAENENPAEVIAPSQLQGVSEIWQTNSSEDVVTEDQIIAHNESLDDVSRQPLITRFPRWEIGVTVGYGTNKVSLNGKDSGAVDRRKSEEHPLDLMSIGGDVRYYLTKKVFLQSGIYYAQFTDRREASWERTITIVDSNYLLERTILLDGTVEEIYGSAILQRIESSNEVIHNRYRMIQVPVAIGYSIPLSRHWLFNVQGGFGVNIWHHSSGAVTDGSNRISLSNAGYRTWGTLDVLGRFEAGYRLDAPGWYLGIGGYGQTGVTDRISGDAMRERRHSFGGQIVIRKVLGIK